MKKASKSDSEPTQTTEQRFESLEKEIIELRLRIEKLEHQLAWVYKDFYRKEREDDV